MKFYMHPASTVCRPIMLFAADAGVEMEQVVVDILAGEQYGAAFAAVNPNNAVPVLEDGDFRMTESSAILKYLADKVASPAYPKDLKQRARVNEIMDWANTSLYRTFGYGLCYPQLLDAYKLAEETAHRLTLEAGKRGAERYLGILNDHILGPNGRHLAGDTETIADYFVSGILSVGELTGCTFAAWPNVRRWYDAIQTGANWRSANAGLYGWAEFVKGPDYVTV